MKFLLALAFALATFAAQAQTPDDLYRNATALAKKKDYKGALKTIDKAIEKDRNNADFLDAKAEYQIALGQYQEAFGTLGEAITLHPQTHRYVNRGLFLYSAQLFELAAADFTKALDLTANDSIRAAVLINRSTAYSAVRNFQAAYDDLMWVHRFDSTNVAALVNLGALSDEIGRGDETLGYLLAAVRQDSTMAGIYVNIGFKYQNANEHEKAVTYFNKAIALDPTEPLAYSNRSYSKLKLGDLKGAMKDIEHSIKLYPSNSWAYRNRALILMEQGKWDQACKELQTALDKGFTKMYGNEVVELMRAHCR